MKQCPNCGNPMEDDATFCTNCGAAWQAAPAADAPQAESAPQPESAPQGNYQANYQADNYQANYQGNYQQPQQPQQPMYMPYDHTREYEAADISYNKVICMAVYLMGVVGIIIAMLAGNTSAYVSFNVREALKICVVEILLGLCALVLAFTILVPIAAGVCEIILLVVRIICFVHICQGKAIEAPIVRGLGFLH